MAGEVWKRDPLFPEVKSWLKWVSHQQTTSAKPFATNSRDAQADIRQGFPRKTRLLNTSPNDKLNPLDVLSRQTAWADDDIDFDVYVEGMRRGAANMLCGRLAPFLSTRCMRIRRKPRRR